MFFSHTFSFINIEYILWCKEGAENSGRVKGFHPRHDVSTNVGILIASPPPLVTECQKNLSHFSSLNQ